ncbi:hypothetical protein OG394_15055 [Kribbella sp. NBC_01245]|uniref:hypothetical protein n=1 Tax=Kribbella sp. NBC_01245 TaxID=2903578 RepID=UPI002E28D371|nr:hypothetical protein [Kribbella sp. NBC_01245]
MRVVLSAPYSGALYRWFRELAGGRTPDAQPYYSALYKEAGAAIDIALTSLIVYEEIVLPFADNNLPGHGDLRHLGLEELGLSVTHEPVHRASAIAERWLEELSNDGNLQGLLHTQGFSSREAPIEINYAIADILISQEVDVAVVASPGRQQIARRIIELGVLDDEISDANRLTLTEFREGPADPVAEYVDLIGLTIRRDDYNAIVDLKHDPNIARYSRTFRDRLGPSGAREPIDFSDALGEVLEKQAAQGTVRGVFKHGGRALGLAGLIPGVGTATGLLGIAGDAAEAALEGRRYTLWHELGTAIKAREFDVAMRQRVQKARKQTTDELLTDLGFSDG